MKEKSYDIHRQRFALLVVIIDDPCRKRHPPDSSIDESGLKCYLRIQLSQVGNYLL